MLAIPPFGASSNIALWRANIKPPFEMVVGDLDPAESLYSAGLIVLISFVLIIESCCVYT